MRSLSRRQILELTSLGFGRVVLSHLLADSGVAAAASTSTPIYNNLHARKGHFPGRAKAVIQLIQNGGPSQMDLFDPKPMLAKLAGKPHPDGVEIHQPGNENTLMPTPFEFRKYGQCGMDISEALPHQAEIVDKLCFIRSMHTEHNNHLEGLNMRTWSRNAASLPYPRRRPSPRPWTTDGKFKRATEVREPPIMTRSREPGASRTP